MKPRGATNITIQAYVYAALFVSISLDLILSPIAHTSVALTVVLSQMYLLYLSLLCALLFLVLIYPQKSFMKRLLNASYVFFVYPILFYNEYKNAVGDAARGKKLFKIVMMATVLFYATCLGRILLFIFEAAITNNLSPRNWLPN